MNEKLQKVSVITADDPPVPPAVTPLDTRDRRVAVPQVQPTVVGVHDDRPGAALDLVPAMVNAARGLDGEPFLISALVRIACDAVAVRPHHGMIHFLLTSGSSRDRPRLVNRRG